MCLRAPFECLKGLPRGPRCPIAINNIIYLDCFLTDFHDMKHVSVRSVQVCPISKVADTIGTSCDAANYDYDGEDGGREGEGEGTCKLRLLFTPTPKQTESACIVCGQNVDLGKGANHR